jgi:hypothetical protein
VGSCLPITAGTQDPPGCLLANGKACNGSGYCKLVPGSACTGNPDCAIGTCQNGICKP